MKLRRHSLSALSLSLVLPLLATEAVGAAQAGEGNRRIYADIGISGSSYLTWNPRIRATTSGDATLARVRAELASDGGDEDLDLVESDTWLHGAATIGALPAADAALVVTLYDTGSAALISLSGTLGADGSVTLAADASTPPDDSADCASRTGCADATTRTDAPDIEVLAAEVFALGGLRDGYPDGSAGYDLSVDLAGADTYDVAYATVTVTEAGKSTCVATDEKGNCLKWETGTEVSTRAEVFWDDVGSVWEAEGTLPHEGLVEVTVKAYDTDGKKLETAKSKLGAPWEDGGAGVNTLATDEDPLTRLALTRGGRHLGCTQVWHAQCPAQLTVVSEGWSAGDALPVDAEVELTDGETITIPVNSYLRVQRGEAAFARGDFTIDYRSTITITGGDVVFADVSLLELTSPLCSGGLCVALIEDEDGPYGLSFTAYGDDADALPDTLDIRYAITGSGVVVDELDEEVTAEERTVVFDDAITAVFANELRFAGDPAGLGLSGRVKLLGDANRRGNQDTLAKGRFYGSFSRDADGELSLAGGDKDEVVSSGQVVQGGEAVFLTDREGAPLPPPAIQYGNGSGTKNATTTTSARPELL